MAPVAQVSPKGLHSRIILAAAMPSKYSSGKVSEVQWTEFQSWMQTQLNQKFREQEAKIKEAFDGLNNRSWQLGDARARAISEMSARHSMGADTELGISASDAVVCLFVFLCLFGLP